MKIPANLTYPAFYLGLLLIAAAIPATAGTVIKADNDLPLSDPSSWVGGNAPTDLDVATWDGTTTVTNAWFLGGSTNWQGIKIGAVTSALTIYSGGTLGLGIAGLDLSTAGANLSLNCDVQLNAAQKWSLNAIPPSGSRILSLRGSLTNNGHTLTVAGSDSPTTTGTLALEGTAPMFVTGNLLLTNGAILNILRSNLTLLGTVASVADTNTAIRAGSSVQPNNVNTIHLADGVNDWNYFAIGGKTNTLVFKASPNSTNLFKKFNVAGQGTIAIASGGDASTMVLDGGYYRITGNVLDANGQAGLGTKIVLTNNAVLNCDHIRGDGSWGGARDVRCSLEVLNGSLFAAHFMGIMMYSAEGLSFVVNNASVTVDHSLGTLDGTTGTGTNTFRGIEIGGANNGQANSASGFSMRGGQTNGLVRVNSPRQFRAFALGNNVANKTNTYVISGAGSSMELNGYRADLVIGAEVNGNGLASFTVLDNAKVSVEGNVRGGQASSAAIQVFDFQSGTLAARGIESVGLRAPGDPAGGTFKNNGGTLAPGGIGIPGQTIVYGNINLAAGVLDIDIGGTNRANAFTNAGNFYDSMDVTTNATLGGSLTVRLVNGFAPSATDQFDIITLNASGGGTVSGTFNNLVTGGPGLGRVAVANQPGASFRVNLNSFGTAVYLNDYQAGGSSQPTITSVAVQGGNLVLQGTNSTGTAGGAYSILSSTNVAAPLATWTSVVTDVFQSGGAFSNAIPINPAQPRAFYSLQLP
jgi:hypothetical protein